MNRGGQSQQCSRCGDRKSPVADSSTCPREDEVARRRVTQCRSRWHVSNWCQHCTVFDRVMLKDLTMHSTLTTVIKLPAAKIKRRRVRWMHQVNAYNGAYLIVTISGYCVLWNVCVNQCTLDLEIDRVERIDSTPLKIDRLDFSRFCRSTPLKIDRLHRLASQCL